MKAEADVMKLTPRRLSTTFHEKVWGSIALEPWYPKPESKTGEVWFEVNDDLPLLVKFIFTSERLSIQVHPDDAQAQETGNPRGKTEMWYILRADHGATLGVGLRETISQERLRSACESGEIEQLLNWIPVTPGDVIFVPAGTIHAIGTGLALCEIQQFSDITYRLYDYGRPRDLHLEEGIRVAVAGPHPGKSIPLVVDKQTKRLAVSPYFVTDEITVEHAYTRRGGHRRPEILIATRGSGTIGAAAYRQGQAWLIPAGAPDLLITPDEPSVFLRTSEPE